MNVEKHSAPHNQPSSKRRLFLLLLAFTFVTGYFIYTHAPVNPVCLIYFNKQDVPRVAHAGGGIDGITYTNSIEAMNLNYARGFRYFEIDFNTTSDAEIVCVHDWTSFRKSGGKDDIEVPLDFDEFQHINESVFEHKRCTLNTLADWFIEHTDAYLVTDVKDNNLETLEVVFESIPNSKRVVIPQIYAPNEYARVVAMGIDRIIWTLYRSELTEDQILQALSKMNSVFAITMPTAKAESSFPVKVLNSGIAVYAHTVNDTEEYKRLTQQNCVSEVYTDFLIPGH